MKSCERCGRNHSGICIIPPGVTLGFGARIGGTGRESTRFSKVKLKMKLTKHGLEEMLDWGLEQEQKCENLLRILPPSLPEYDEVLTRLDKLRAVNNQIKRQLATKGR